MFITEKGARVEILAVDFCKWIEVPMPDEASNLRRRHEVMQA